MFADDTNLFIKDKNLGSLVANANNELAKISNWFKLNKLSLNIKKTNFILFTSRKRKLDEKPEIKIDGTVVGGHRRDLHILCCAHNSAPCKE